MVVAVRRPIEREDAAWLVPATWPQTRTDRYGATPMGRGSRRCAAGCAGTRAEAGIIGRPSGLANDDPPRAASQPRACAGRVNIEHSTRAAAPQRNPGQAARPGLSPGLLPLARTCVILNGHIWSLTRADVDTAHLMFWRHGAVRRGADAAREDPLTPRQISRCRRPWDFLATSSVPHTAFPQVTSPSRATRRRKSGLAGAHGHAYHASQWATRVTGSLKTGLKSVRPADRPCDPPMPPCTPGSDAGCRTCSLLVRDDHDWASRVLDDLVTHRADQQTGETAAAACSDDYQVGILRRIDQFPGHKAVYSVDGHRGWPGIAEPAGGLLRHLLSGLAQFF